MSNSRNVQELEQLLQDALTEIKVLKSKGSIKVLKENVSYEISVANKIYIIDVKKDYLYKII